MNKTFNILFLSNMMKEKGVWTLVDACKILIDKGYNFNCILVGKWSDITEIEFNKTINKYSLDKYITAVGGKYGSEKDYYWNSTDLFVFPTFYSNECFPLVLLEAMQKHKACISTYEGAISDII